MKLIKEFYSKLKMETIAINFNKNRITMDLFKSFLTVEIIPNPEYTCYFGWTENINNDIGLIVKGGIIDGIEYLDNIQYGKKLDNPYNNFVNPFYLGKILTKKGVLFFLDYYKKEIEDITNKYVNQIAEFKAKKENAEIILQQINIEIENLKK